MKNNVSNTGSLKKRKSLVEICGYQAKNLKKCAVGAKTFKRFSFRSKFDVFESSKSKKKFKKKV